LRLCGAGGNCGKDQDKKAGKTESRHFLLLSLSRGR
jgi:hypothetical protein